MVAGSEECGTKILCKERSDKATTDEHSMPYKRVIGSHKCLPPTKTVTEKGGE